MLRFDVPSRLPSWRDLTPGPDAPAFVVGVDLGELHDHTALAVLKRRAKLPEPTYDLVHLERVPLRTSYVEVVRQVKGAIETIMDAGEVPRLKLAIDGTGVGVAVLDLFRAADLGVSIVPISIHGGQKVVHEGGFYRVPKKDLIGVLTVLFQNHRIRIATATPHTNALVKELATFKRSFTKLGHEQFGADAPWREGVFDDLILATSIAAWTAESGVGASWGDMDTKALALMLASL